MIHIHRLHIKSIISFNILISIIQCLLNSFKRHIRVNKLFSAFISQCNVVNCIGLTVRIVQINDIIPRICAVPVAAFSRINVLCYNLKCPCKLTKRLSVLFQRYYNAVLSLRQTCVLNPIYILVHFAVYIFMSKICILTIKLKRYIIWKF